MTEPTHEQKLISYLLDVISQSSTIPSQRRKPDWVPCRIRVNDSLLPHFEQVPTPLDANGQPIEKNLYGCQTNIWGAIFIALPNSQRLGVYIHECEILELRANVKKQMEAAGL